MTGAVSIQNAGRSTTCAGRSLSSAHGSVSVPIVNGPAGTSASAAAGGATAAGRVRGVQHRRAGAQLVRGEHRLVVLLLVLHDHPEGEARARPAAGPRSGLDPSASSAFSRTCATYSRASAGPSRGSSTRLARECRNAS